MNADPSPQNSVLAAAVNWLVALLRGDLATTIAIVAVAGLGLSLLAGRLPKRRGIQLVIGCFIIFGAPTIAAGIFASLAGAQEARESDVYVPTALADVLLPPQTPARTQPYDPYAGAALPPRR